MSSATAGSVRYHDLDALRAFAMLLGVGFHTAATIEGLPEAQHGAAKVGVRWITVTTHSFRMPVFFVMAGFFAALVVTRSGPRAFARARLKRIGLPLVVGSLLLIPLLNLTSAWGTKVRTGHAPHIDLDLLTRFDAYHLWFLWYLLLYYAVGLALRKYVGHRPDSLLRFITSSRWRLLFLVPLTAAVIWDTPLWAAEVPQDFGVHIEPFVYYGMFFTFGWWLYSNRELIEPMRRDPVPHTIAALLAATLVIVISEVLPDGGTSRQLARLAIVFLTAVVTWSSIFALFGWFGRWFRRPSPRVRWVADSAYWLYLAHLPLVAALVYGLTDIGVPLVVKLIAIPIVVSAFLLATYGWFVRYSFIGNVLHGPRKRPEAQSQT